MIVYEEVPEYPGWRYLSDGEITRDKDIVYDTETMQKFDIGLNHTSVGEVHLNTCMNVMRKIIPSIHKFPISL